MAYLSLQQLIALTNLSREVKEDALANIEKLNEDQKFRLSQVCWENIASQYENKARLEYEDMLEEMASGQKSYPPEAFAQLDDKIVTELLKVIQTELTEEQLTEVKGELQKHLDKSAATQ